MEQNGFDRASFTPEQIRKVLGSDEGKRLLEILNRDGGAALRQAAAAYQAGDSERVRQLMEPLMRAPEAAGLIERLNRG